MLVVMLKISFQSFYFLRKPDEKFNTSMKVMAQWAESLSTLNPKQYFFQSFALLKDILNYDLSQSLTGLSIFIEGASLFMWTGISFTMSRKILDYSKNAGAVNHPASLIDYRFVLKMHYFHTGQIEEDPDFLNVYHAGLSVGDHWPTTIYSVYCGLTCVELGKYDRLVEIVNKIDEISESFDNSHAKAQMYRLSVMAHYRFRMMDRALELSDAGISFTSKTGHFAMLLVIWCAKSLAHSAKKELDAAKRSLAEAEKLVKDRKIITIYHFAYVLAKAHLEFQELTLALERKESQRKSGNSLLNTIGLLIRLSKKMRSAATEAYRLKAQTCWMLGKQRQACKYFTLSIRSAQKYNCRLELSRTYYELGKCLRDPKNNETSLMGLSGSEYLFKARRMFEEMDLQWDLKEYERYMET